MKEKALTALINATIKAGFQAQVPPLNYPVAAAYQPTQQAVPSTPVVYLYKVGPDQRYGFLKREDIWDGSKFVHTETQIYTSTYQAMALFPQTAGNTTSDTAADLVETVAAILQSDAGRAQLQTKKVGILRVQAIRNIPFVDDKGRNEFAPSFDFTVTHTDVRISQTPAVEAFEVDIKRV